jgi:hypothetical protein
MFEAVSAASYIAQASQESRPLAAAWYLPLIGQGRIEEE